MTTEDHPEILDCTIRDGGYCNNWYFNKELVREAYRALSKSGVDYVELGFRGTEQNFDPEKFGLWRFSTEDDLKEVTSNIQGANIALMGDYGKIELDDLLLKKDSCIDLVRVAASKNNIFHAINLLEKIKGNGYKVSLQCMGYSTYIEHEKKELLDALKKTELDYVYVADSYGSMFPFQVKEFFEPFLELGNFKVGFHPHNNIQMAFANTLEAIRVGVDIIDTTIYGMGRGAGNLPTEIFLSYLSVQGDERYNAIPVLNCIERYFLDLMQDSPWGYQLPYMISGIFNSHPNYSKEMLKRKEYSMEDIWKTLEYVQELKPVGFDVNLVDKLISKGFVSIRNKEDSEAVKLPKKDDIAPNVPAPYLDRYVGREFLVLANGPNLKKYKKEIDRFIKKYNPIVLGANFLNGLFEPDYHAFNNKKRFASYAGTISERSKLLVGTNIPEDMIAEYVIDSYERLPFIDVLGSDFDIQDGVITSNCRTISVLLIGVAVAMGAKRVFVAGMDGYIHKSSVSSTLFYDEKFDPKEHKINLERHRWNEHFLFQIDNYIKNSGAEGVHILTPTSHSAYSKRIENFL